MRVVLLAATAALLTACIDQHEAQTAIDAMLPSGVRPEVMPRVLNDAPPFVYPRAAYDARLHGDVLLRLWIDTSGVPSGDSIRVQEHAAQAVFDSAALAGAPSLRFSPAMQDGSPVAVSVLLPVQFRRR